MFQCFWLFFVLMIGFPTSLSCYFAAISEERFYESSRREEQDMMEISEQSPDLRHYLSPRGDGESATKQLAASTISAPEVSLVPSPGLITKVGHLDSLTPSVLKSVKSVCRV